MNATMPFTPVKPSPAGAPDPYKGSPSTLCKGCGHDSISSQIIAVCREMAINPRGIIKLSGIGCSSKTPAYFLGQAHGFNSVHGRMPSVATGAALANHHLLPLGVSDKLLSCLGESKTISPVPPTVWLPLKTTFPPLRSLTVSLPPSKVRLSARMLWVT